MQSSYVTLKLIKSTKDKVKKSEWKETGTMMLLHLGMWSGVAAYLVIGAGILYAIEGESEYNLTGNASLFGFDNQTIEVLDESSSLGDDLPRKAILDLPQKVDMMGIDLPQKVMSENSTDWHWYFTSGIRFTFCLTTTIGTGDVAPTTDGAKVFVMIYGLVGIPFTMLALADFGKFLMDGVLKIHRNVKHFLTLLYKTFRRNKKEKDDGKNKKPDPEEGDTGFCLLIFFLVYMGITIWIVPFFMHHNLLDRVYLSSSFITFTTLGFSDIVLKKSDSLVVLVYVVLGLVLLTMSIEAAAQAFRKIHYLGSKLKNAGAQVIHFGGQSMTVNDLLTSFATKHGIPASELENFDLDDMVKNTLKGLPIKPIMPEDFKLYTLLYVDDDSAVVEAYENGALHDKAPPPIKYYSNNKGDPDHYSDKDLLSES